jgi:hypothetical protein
MAGQARADAPSVMPQYHRHAADTETATEAFGALKENDIGT